MAIREDEFGRTAVELGFVTDEQVAECLALAAERRKGGDTITLGKVLVEKAYLTTPQANAVLRKLKAPRLSHIGKYRLQARIGQGGMGTVYKAKQESLDKIVAVKLLSPALARRPDYVKRFLREARSCGQLNHPNVVLGIAAGEADGYYYFAMEYVDGPSLKAILRREKKIPETRALEITAAMAAALEHAQEHNIVHRDIKPGNILLTSEGTAKLADLGLAKEIHTDQSITQAGIPVGTPYYISPEQIRGQQDIDQRADLYALGATLYHLVTGIVPYEGHTGPIVMSKHLNEPIPDPRAHTPELSAACRAIIQHAMEKDRDARYQNATELREDVEAALAHKTPPHARKAAAAASSQAQRRAERRAQAAARKKRNTLIGIGVGAAAVVAIILGLVLGRGCPEKDSRDSARKAARDADSKGKTRADDQAAKKTPTPSAKTRPTRPATKTEPAKPPPKPRKTPAELEKELQHLVDSARSPDDRQAVEQKLSAFIRENAGAPVAGRAGAQLDSLKKRWKALDDLKDAIDDDLRMHDYADALGRLKTPPVKEKSEEQNQIVAELTERVEQAADEHVAEKQGEADELILKGEFAAAKKICRELAQLKLPKATAASQGAIARIEKTEAARRERLARDELAKVLREAAAHVKAGKLKEARALFDPVQYARNESLARLVEPCQGDIDRIAKLFADVEAELKERAAKGQTARINRIGRRIAKVEDGKIHCAAGGKVFAIHELSDVDLRDLKSATRSPVRIPLLQLYRSEASQARAALEALGKQPPDPAVPRWIELARCAEAGDHEKQAQRAFAKAEEAANQGQWAAASKLIARLHEDYGETDFAKKSRAKITGLSQKATAALVAARRAGETPVPFLDVTKSSGDLGKYLTAIGSGQAPGGWVVDIDNDGRLDIAIDTRNGGKLIPIFRNETKPGSRDAAVFRDITKLAGLAAGDEPICWADLDGDGDLDVVCRGLFKPGEVLRAGDHRSLSFYENGGLKAKPMFQQRTRGLAAKLGGEKGGFQGYGFGNIAVLDANGDGRSDILAQFVPGPKNRTLCLFLAVAGKPFEFQDFSERAGFYRKRGDTVRTAPSLQVDAWPNYVVFDANGDDRADFIFNTDSGMLLLNRLRTSRTFDPAKASGVTYKTYASGATGGNPRIVPAVADYDNDGDIDVYIPQNGKNLLLRNLCREQGRAKSRGRARFQDAMGTAGPMSRDEADSLWATWADVNNDGLPDLFVCNAGANNSLYIQTANHAFVDKAEQYGVAGKPSDATNFVAFGDFDRDGDMDMFILRDKGHNQLLLSQYINKNKSNRYSLRVLVRPKLGAIGAKVYLRKPGGEIIGLQQVCRVEGFNRQTPREAFFGIPAPGDYEVRVVLSSGRQVTRRVTIDPAKDNVLAIR